MSTLSESTDTPTASMVFTGESDEMEDDVQIVDHQIEDDIHVRAAFEKRDEDGGIR